MPEPGRKVLMLMVLPGAGNWASMMALINGWTSAGESARRLSTSSNTCQVRTNTKVLQCSSVGSAVAGVYLGEQVETAEVTNDTINLWQALAFSTGLKHRRKLTSICSKTNIFVAS